VNAPTAAAFTLKKNIAIIDFSVHTSESMWWSESVCQESNTGRPDYKRHSTDSTTTSYVIIISSIDHSFAAMWVFYCLPLKPSLTIGGSEQRDCIWQTDANFTSQ
jgi:hypothetical protein